MARRGTAKPFSRSWCLPWELWVLQLRRLGTVVPRQVAGAAWGLTAPAGVEGESGPRDPCPFTLEQQAAGTPLAEKGQVLYLTARWRWDSGWPVTSVTWTSWAEGVGLSSVPDR